MEMLGAIATGLALFTVGNYLGFKLGRSYEKALAIKFMSEVTELLRKRLGMSDSTMIEHLRAIRDSTNDQG